MKYIERKMKNNLPVAGRRIKAKNGKHGDNNRFKRATAQGI